MTHHTKPGSTFGRGSIYQRSSDGRWIAAVELSQARGDRRRKTFTGATREAVEARLEAWRAENPATPYLGRAEFMRLAREKGTHKESEYWAKVRACGGVCAYCHRKIALADFHGDHIIPISRGGSDGIDNIAVACRDCNSEKGSMTAVEYRAWKKAKR